MVRSKGNMSLKNPVTPPGINPGTVQLVAQRLNHYASPGPRDTKVLEFIVRNILGSYQGLKKTVQLITMLLDKQLNGHRRVMFYRLCNN